MDLLCDNAFHWNIRMFSSLAEVPSSSVLQPFSLWIQVSKESDLLLVFLMSLWSLVKSADEVLRVDPWEGRVFFLLTQDLLKGSGMFRSCSEQSCSRVSLLVMVSSPRESRSLSQVGGIADLDVKLPILKTETKFVITLSNKLVSHVT